MDLPEQVLDNESIMLQFVSYTAGRTVCQTLWNASLIGPTRFRVGRLSEDGLFWLDILKQPLRGASIPDVFYLYRRRENSISTTPDVMVKSKLQDTKVLRNIMSYELFREWKKPERAKQAYRQAFLDYHLLQRFKVLPYPENHTMYITFFRQHKKDYLLDHPPLREQFGLRLLTLFPRFYRACVRVVSPISTI